jgi:RNA polymerase sigma-70 factor (ECF subfamily)
MARTFGGARSRLLTFYRSLPLLGGRTDLSREICELVDRCLAGQPAAIVELVERFRGRVFGLCYRMLGHLHDAEDVTQESLVRALRSLACWDQTRDFEPWLLAIAGNRCRTWLAARSRRPATTSLLNPVVDVAAGPTGFDSLAEEVGLALGTLRAEYRQAFLLFHEQQLSYLEIAAALDCPVGTVKTWVHRARRELVDRLARRGVLEESYHAVR